MRTPFMRTVKKCRRIVPIHPFVVEMEIRMKCVQPVHPTINSIEKYYFGSMKIPSLWIFRNLERRIWRGLPGADLRTGRAKWRHRGRPPALASPPQHAEQQHSSHNSNLDTIDKSTNIATTSSMMKIAITIATTLVAAASAQEAIAAPLWCPASPEQTCRLVCAEASPCPSGQCNMREDTCCDSSCVAYEECSGCCPEGARCLAPDPECCASDPVEPPASACSIGRDCGGQVHNDCGSACPPICGEEEAMACSACASPLLRAPPPPRAAPPP